ncbi:MAG: hypothetical protein AAFO91_17170 [Bacteroidota bacterium]
MNQLIGKERSVGPSAARDMGRLAGQDRGGLDFWFFSSKEKNKP